MVRSIAHLSFPVRDLDEAVEFYTARLGAETGRRTPEFVDVLLFGSQLTLQHDPGSVTTAMPRTRHFGWTLPWPAWESVSASFDGSSVVVEAAKVSYSGEPIEQGKIMISDPSGNLIELKAYRHPDQVLGALASMGDHGW
jgi:extradiol dioxygenase family protein